MSENHTAGPGAAPRAGESADLHVPALSPALGPIAAGGLISVCVYLLIVGVVFLYARSCDGMFCGTASIIPALPWAIIIPPLMGADLGGLSALHMAVLLVGCYGLNGWLCYQLGRLIGYCSEPEPAAPRPGSES